jgi:hypothetical protein
MPFVEDSGAEFAGAPIGIAKARPRPIRIGLRFIRYSMRLFLWFWDWLNFFALILPIRQEGITVKYTRSEGDLAFYNLILFALFALAHFLRCLYDRDENVYA